MPGSILSDTLGVSRQAIVHDIAVLRAQGAPIEATTRGYLFQRPVGTTAVFMVRHLPAQTQSELYGLVDAGLTVVDVLVEHPIYGELRGGLDLHSRSDVDDFLQRIEDHQGGLLSSLTNGLHWHTVRGRDQASIAKGRQALQNLGIWLDETPNK